MLPLLLPQLLLVAGSAIHVAGFYEEVLLLISYLPFEHSRLISKCLVIAFFSSDMLPGARSLL